MIKILKYLLYSVIAIGGLILLQRFTNSDIIFSTDEIRNYIMVVAAIIALMQWKESNKIRKAEFLETIINDLRKNRDISEALYIIDYQNGWYNENFHDSIDKTQINKGMHKYKNTLEYKIDSLLYTLDYICYLRKIQCIGREEMQIAKYTIKNICKSQDVKCYLWNLYNASKQYNEYYNIKERECSILDAQVRNCSMKKNYIYPALELFGKTFSYNTCSINCSYKVYQFKYLITYITTRGFVPKEDFDIYPQPEEPEHKYKKVYLKYLKSKKGLPHAH